MISFNIYELTKEYLQNKDYINGVITGKPIENFRFKEACNGFSSKMNMAEKRQVSTLLMLGASMFMLYFLLNIFIFVVTVGLIMKYWKKFSDMYKFAIISSLLFGFPALSLYLIILSIEK